MEAISSGPPKLETRPEILTPHPEFQPEDPLTRHYRLQREGLERLAKTGGLSVIPCTRGDKAYIETDVAGQKHFRAVVNNISGLVVYPGDKIVLELARFRKHGPGIQTFLASAVPYLAHSNPEDKKSKPEIRFRYRSAPTDSHTPREQDFTLRNTIQNLNAEIFVEKGESPNIPHEFLPL